MLSHSVKLALTCLSFYSSLSSAATSKHGLKIPTGWSVPGVGTFNSQLTLDFTKSSSLGSDMRMSDYTVSAGGAPYAHSFTPNNVHFNPGDSISLLVPRVSTAQNVTTIPSAEIVTAYDDILYGSIRVVAKPSTTAGTCKGFFFYQADNQETDIEILTNREIDDLSGVWFTNQRVHPGAKATTYQVPPPKNYTDGYHEYRIDWLPGSTRFYLDGVLRNAFTQNVASKPSSFVINNWSNGDKEWSAGPPRQLSDLRIRSIVGYFNRTSVASGK
ncbi:hypothetical protein ANO11243_047250 [Dothideomycetidae sp. 11243]|nr:hypothetical protein ANO11243_047250 [fungal sp. No.11243]